jgi:hypothetical protein
MTLTEYDREIDALAESASYQQAVKALTCYKGIKNQFALTIVTEIGDIKRFDLYWQRLNKLFNTVQLLNVVKRPFGFAGLLAVLALRFIGFFEFATDMRHAHNQCRR